MPIRHVFQRILCPVDFSAHSRLALLFARNLAKRSRGRLFVLFVDDPLLAAAARAVDDRRGLRQTTERELRQFGARSLGREAAQRTTFLVTEGNPAREINRTAGEVGADLIVVGTEGLGGTSKLFFGSTTERLLWSASVPVLAVPPMGRPSASRLKVWPRQVLAVTDVGSVADAKRAASIARWFDTRGPLLTLVTADGAGDQIAAAAAQWKVGLIVVTLPRARRLFAARKGSLAYKVLRGAAIPLLALPERTPARGAAR
jgi:nucleotide-binding universal stress UspA family protein